MSIYIKGMEMPTSCEKCPFLDYEEGFCFASGVKGKSGWYEFTWCPSGIKDGRHKDCPLVPVPPHGRLIDADALSKSFEKTANYYYEHGSEVSSSFWSGGEICTEWYAVEDLLENAPTIIPEEEGET